MTRATLSLLAPPLAVARYGCAGRCAGPIGMVWMAGIASLVYGGLGGPLRSGSVAWTVVGLGVVLLMTACAWALLTVQGVSDDHQKERRARCNTRGIVSQPPAGPDDSDPLEEVRRCREEN